MKFFYCLVFLLLSRFAFSQVGAWTIMKAGPPSYGTMGVASLTNEPAASIGCGYWVDTSGNFWIYGGLDAYFNFYSALWVYKLATNEWIWINGSNGVNQPENIAAAQGVYSAANSPGNLGAGIFTWVSANNHFWIYGGGTFQGVVKGDLWQYNPLINQWAWMGSYTNPNWGAKGVANAANAPGARYEGNSSWVDTLGNLWLFGGFGNRVDYSDMWKYNTTSGLWAWMSGADINESPGVYGTRGVPSVNNHPGARSVNLFWTDQAGNFWLGDGCNFDHDVFYQDIWNFNPYTLQWTWINGPTDSSTYSAPAGTDCQINFNSTEGTRFGNSAVWNVCNDLIFNYGGYYYRPNSLDVIGFNDLWAYSPSQNGWEEIPENQVPAALYGSEGFTDKYYNLWLFGGSNDTTGDNFNDLWRFVMDTSCVGSTGCPNNCVLASPLTISAFPDSICPGDSSLICPTSAYASYLWSSNATGRCIEASATGAYSLLATDNSGCTAVSNTLIMKAAQAPSVTITATSDSICPGDSAKICPGENFSSYRWSPAAGGAATQCFEARNQGAYYLIATDNTGCTAQSNAINLAVFPASIILSAQSDSICPGDSVQICAPPGFSNYSWNPAIGGNISRCIEAKSGGNYSVTATSTNGCVAASNTVAIKVRQQPMVSLAANHDTICTGDSAQICATPGFLIYDWSYNISSHINNVPSCAYAKAQGNYSVTAVDNYGCAAASNTVSISVVQAPSVSISSNTDSVCAGDSTQICATSVFNSYRWNAAAGGATTKCIAAKTGGTYYLIATANNGCAAQSNSINITVTEASLTISAVPDTICPGDSAQICAPPGYLNYSWNPAPGGNTGRCIEAKSGASYSVTATFNNGCLAQSNPVAVTVLQAATATVTANHDSICAGDSAQICATGNFSHYMWNPAWGGATTLCIEAQTPGAYYIIAGNGNGCGNVQSNSVIINAGQPPTVTIGASSDSICPGDSAIMCSTVNFSSYNWSPAAGGDNTHCIEAKTPGTYYLIATNNNGCTAQSNSIHLTQSVNCAGQGQPQSCTAYSADTAQGEIPILWGLTPDGGANDVGVLFNFNTSSNTYSNQYSFTGASGDFPYGSLMQASNGLLFGMTNHGGANGQGVLFSFNPCSNSFADLYNFAANNSSGGNPYSNLLQAANGLLYGMTYTGGANGVGVIFSFNPASNVYINLYSFAGGNNSGAFPWGTSLVQANSGVFYGMTYAGGTNDSGVIFSFNPASNTYTNLYNFAGGNSGGYPQGGLIQASNGLLYGMAYGGLNSDGVIFSFNPTGNVYTILYNFAGGNNSGRSPSYLTSLVQAGNGLLYGMTSEGGANDVGVIFSFSPPTNNYTNLYSFAGNNNSGANPEGTLVQAANGVLYGMASSGGAYGVEKGVIFSFNSVGNVYTNLYSFSGNANSGSYPFGNLLILAQDSQQNQCNGVSVTIAAADSVVCAGGDSAQICPTQSFNTYRWSNNASAECIKTLTPGNYTLTVTNANGCTAQSNTVTINSAQVSVSISANPAAICNGDSARICPNGNFSSYAWSNNANTQCIEAKFVGTYTLTVTNNNGCTVQSNSLSLQSGQTPSVTISAAPDTICAGDSVKICPTANFLSYVWNPAAGGATTRCIEAKNPGTYYLIAGNGTGCAGQSNSINITQGAGCAGQAQPQICNQFSADTAPGQTPILWGLTSGGGTNGWGVIFNWNTNGNAYTNVYNFEAYNNGARPWGNLIQATNGLLYGMTKSLGVNNYGVIFSFNPCMNTYTSLYNFAGDSNSGSYPEGSLVQATNGLLHGMTTAGGVYGSGVIFSFNPATNTYTNLYSFFDSSSGGVPYGNLIQAGNGLLYGLTTAGGANDGGVLFSFSTATNTYTNLYNFVYGNGYFPSGSLIQVANGLLYGVAGGGADSSGVIFSFNLSGNIYTDVYNFAYESTSGYGPRGNLVQAANGLLYGMASNGGTDNDGVIFSFNAAGNVYTDVYNFAGGNNSGAGPNASLIQAGNGLLYGMTDDGGANGIGVVFSFNPAGNAYTNLYSFAGSPGSGNASGAHPFGSLLALASADTAQNQCNGVSVTIAATDSVVCGGGDSAQICPTQSFNTYRWSNNASAECIKTLTPGNYTLTVTNANGCTAQSNTLTINAAQGSVTISANPGAICNGDSARICPNGNFSSYAWSNNANTQCIEAKFVGTYTLTVTNNNGCTAQSNSLSITQSADCNGQGQSQSCTAYAADTAQGQTPILWGLTSAGGGFGEGVLFNFNATGNTYNNIYTFENNDSSGGGPSGNVIQASNGLLYGLAEHGGMYANGVGVIFSFNPCTNAYATLYSFADDSFSGATPMGSLVQANNGLLYGMTSEGGDIYNSEGVIFNFNPANNAYTNLYSFGGVSNDGSNPERQSLIQASNGMLYGMTWTGGSNLDGVIFSFNPTTNGYATLYSFSAASGEYPQGSLVQAANGLLYGLTSGNGINDGGTLFSFNSAGNIYTVLYNFGGNSNGSVPNGSLVQASNGLLYGMTTRSGAYTDGVIFSFNPAGNVYTDVYDFAGGNNSGATPYGDLRQAGNGLLYGMTQHGGANGIGVVFSFNPATNVYTNLYSFAGSDGSGADPIGSLLILAQADTAQNQPLNCNTFAVTITAPDTFTCPGGTVPLSASSNAGQGGTYYDTLNMRHFYNSCWDSGSYPFPGPFGTVPGVDTLSGIPFTLGCLHCDNFWFANNVPGSNPIILSLPVGQKNIDSVFALVNTGWGATGGPYASIQLWSGGANVFEKDLYGNVDIRDYNNSVYTNYINSTSTINVYTDPVTIRRIDMVQIAVPANLYNTKIDSILFVDNGAVNLQRIGVTGVTLKIADTGGVNYVWSTGATASSINVTPQQTTVYTVTAAASGCTATASVNITTHAPMLTITTADSVFCNGDSTSICASAGYASYTWSNNSTGDCIEAKNSGSYHVIASANNGCTAESNSINISVSQSLSVSINASPDSICPGGSTQICPNGNFTLYSWSNNAGTQCIEAQNVGVYTLTVTDNPGCTAQSNSLRIYAAQAQSVSISASPDTICAGDTAQICPNKSFTVYAWSPASGGASTQCIEALNPGLYTLTVTDNKGCTAQSNALTVYQAQSPTATVSANKDSICPGDSARLCATGNFLLYIWNNRDTTLCMETQTPGTYFLRAAYGNGCSVESNSVVISASQAPNVTIAAATDSICSGDSVQICATSNFSTYTWNPAGGGATTQCIEAKNQGTYYLMAGNNGCAGQSNSVAITIRQAPSVTITANSDSICSGDSTQICPSSNFSTYTWNPAGGGASTRCIEAKNQGTYYLMAGNNGCTAQSNSVAITVRQAPVVTISANPDSICSGDSAQICPTSNFSTYIWNPAGGGATTRCIEAKNQGTYFLIAGNNGCTAQSNSVAITVRQAPVVTISANPDSICSGDSAQICPTSNFSTYTWNPAGGGASTRCIEAKNQGTYYLTTGNNGCTAQSNSVAITVRQAPTVTISANPDSICSGDSAQICPTSNFSTYTWNPAGGGATTRCIEAKNQGTYYLTATDNNGCTAQSNAVAITVRQAPSVTISANPDSICSGDSAQICPSSNFSTYTWNPAGGGASTRCIEAKNQGAYYLIASDNNGCTAQSNSVAITVRQAPSVTITANPDSICTGDSAQLCATPGFVTYFWSPPFGGQGACIEARNQGTYYLTASDNNGCTAQSSPLSIVVMQIPTVSITAASDSICTGDSAQICATQGFATYNWNPAIGGATGNCIQAHNSGAYSVAVSDNNGCTAQSNPLSIVVMQIPTVNIIAASDSICTGDSAQLCATPGFVTYFWSSPFGGQGACIEAHTTGSYNVTVTDNHSCTAQSAPVNITVGNTLTTAITTNADSICTGDTAKICAPPGFAIYNWNPAIGGTTANCIHTISTGNYYVSVSDNTGCSALSNTISITALQSATAIVTANPPSFCPGSSAQICATAGYATYRWTYNNNNSNCIEVQRADNYAVTVTDNNGCTAASNPISITLQSAPPVTITAQPENVCPGDSSKICAPQGLEAYLWSTNATGNCIHTASAGNYNLTVTDNNGCTALSNHISINVYPKPSVTISTGLDTICPGDSTKICAPATLTFTAYLWNIGANTTCMEAKNAGDYYVTVTDNVGCTAESNHINITALPIPQVSISRIGDTLIANNAINCQWYFNNAIIQDATKNIYIAHNDGSYTVSVTDSDGCSGFSSPILFTGTGVDDISGDDNILVYPNPLSVGKWQMAVSNNFIGAQVEILDAEGRVVYKSEIKATHSEIEAPFAEGVYLLRIVTGTGIVARKLVKL